MQAPAGTVRTLPLVEVNAQEGATNGQSVRETCS